MKIFAAFAAGLVALATTAPASAQMEHRTTTRVVTTETNVRHDTRRNGWNDRRHGYNRHKTRRVCDWRYRDHHRVRVCRTIRW